jgi:hypothetical protein
MRLPPASAPRGGASTRLKRIPNKEQNRQALSQLEKYRALMPGKRILYPILNDPAIAPFSAAQLRGDANAAKDTAHRLIKLFFQVIF